MYLPSSDNTIKTPSVAGQVRAYTPKTHWCSGYGEYAIEV